LTPIYPRTAPNASYPSELGGRSTTRFQCIFVYRAAGLPAFVLELKEIVRFEGDRICRLEDQYQPAMVQSISAYLKEHGGKLGISAD